MPASSLSAPSRALRARRVALLAMVLIYLGQGLYYSRALVSSDDEESYLAAGYLAVTGAISLFQDDMTGQRVPLPFYVLGSSQLVFGRNLWAARLLSLALGLGVLALTVLVARRLHSSESGLLAGFFLATQGAIVGYYATASYHALTALILMAVVWVILKDDLPWRYPLAMAVASILFFTRTNMLPALLFFFVWTLVGARTRLVRVLVVLIGAMPPAIFFLADETHLKLLAHVPLLERWVESLGYRSVLYFQPVAPADATGLSRTLVLFARRYESWVLAAAGMALAGGLALARGRRLTSPARSRAAALIAGLWLWILLWHFVIFRVNVKWTIAYFPDFAPLLASLLGVAAATLLGRSDFPGLARASLAGALAAGFVVSVFYVRNPLMPTPAPRPFREDPVQLLERSAVRLKALVPTNARLFLFGRSMPVYLAGLRPYLPQLMTPRSLTMNDADAHAVARSGVWGRREVERWLGHEAQYAVVSPALLDVFAADRPESVGRIRTLLAERFAPLGRVDDAPWIVYDVYRRRLPAPPG